MASRQACSADATAGPSDASAPFAPDPPPVPPPPVPPPPTPPLPARSGATSGPPSGLRSVAFEEHATNAASATRGGRFIIMGPSSCASPPTPYPGRARRRRRRSGRAAPCRASAEHAAAEERTAGGDEQDCERHLRCSHD